jgi:hypothetical protein
LPFDQQRRGAASGLGTSTDTPIQTTVRRDGSFRWTERPSRDAEITVIGGVHDEAAWSH